MKPAKFFYGDLVFESYIKAHYTDQLGNEVIWLDNDAVIPVFQLKARFSLGRYFADVFDLAMVGHEDTTFSYYTSYSEIDHAIETIKNVSDHGRDWARIEDVHIFNKNGRWALKLQITIYYAHKNSKYPTFSQE